MTVKSYPCSQHILMCMHAENFIYLQVSCKVALFLLVLYTLFFRVGIFDGHSVSNDVMVLHHCSGLGPILPGQFFLSPPPMV